MLSRASSGEPDDELTEQHWSYMDRFAAGMTARGPTFAPDRETWTGSMHVVDLPSVAAAHAFVSEEPYAGAGLFESHRTWLFTNLLGRTMWDHVDQTGDPTFLVLASSAIAVEPDRLLMSGELHRVDGRSAGFVAAAQVPDPSLLEQLPDSEVHAWEPGGRR